MCCGRFHTGTVLPPTAEALMRSRYSAFAVGAVDYLLTTWHPDTRPRTLQLDDVAWRRLDIVRTAAGGPFDDEGVVEFVAHHRSLAGSGTLHEVSAFVREGGRWYYVDGEIRA